MSLQLVVQNADGDAFSVAIEGDRITLGRSSACDIRLPYSTISGHHMTLELGDGVYHLRDAGSTNGSWIDGRQLGPDESVAIERETVVDVLTTRLRFRPSLQAQAQFTMEESGTLARKLLSDAIETPDQDDAFFEILVGAQQGDRIRVEEGLILGMGGDVNVTTSDAATVVRKGEGFAIQTTSGAVSVNDDAIGGAKRLKSKDRVEIGDVTAIFFDPLEAYFSELESTSMSLPAAPQASKTLEPEPTPIIEEKEKGQRGWTPVEWALLLFALGLLVVGIVAIVFVMRM